MTITAFPKLSHSTETFKEFSLDEWKDKRKQLIRDHHKQLNPKTIQLSTAKIRQANAAIKFLGISYRLYADDTLISEDLFSEYDNSQPYYDDYYQTIVPLDLDELDEIEAYIKMEMSGK